MTLYSKLNDQGERESQKLAARNQSLSRGDKLVASAQKTKKKAAFAGTCKLKSSTL